MMSVFIGFSCTEPEAENFVIVKINLKVALQLLWAERSPGKRRRMSRTQSKCYRPIYSMVQTYIKILTSGTRVTYPGVR